MLDEEIPDAAYQPWRPMTDPVDLKVVGKLIEELGECVAAAARCQIQGIDESEPTTGVVNRVWLEDEIADVQCNIRIVVGRFKLDMDRIQARHDLKMPLLLAWHKEA